MLSKHYFKCMVRIEIREVRRQEIMLILEELDKNITFTKVRTQVKSAKSKSHNIASV